MRRALTTWSVIFGLVVLAFIGTVVALNNTIYSAHGFVQSYLDSLARRDAEGALALPGVTVTDAAARDLLTRAALGDLSDIRLVSDVADGPAHRVTFAYEIGGHAGRTEFVVKPDGHTLGLFDGWRFAVSPIGTVALTVQHDQRFDVNGLATTTTAEPNGVANFAVFTPGRYAFGHTSTYLTAEPVPTDVTAIGDVTPVVVNVEANDFFVAQVQKELNDYLDTTCVPQQVLLPTGCPFGHAIADRVVSTPAWTMSVYPAVTVIPGTDPGTWAVPSTSAAAHLVVDVQSLFDGTVTTFDEDVPFSVRYSITFQPDGSLYISATYG
jgi:hypothetical protein